MRQMRGFIAVTLDGFIADSNHGIGFLDSYPSDGPIFDAFMAEIGTVVMGRLTYEVIRRNGLWTYGDKQALNVTSEEIDDLPAGATLWRDGIDALVAHLRGGELPPGDVWILGGGMLQQAFIDRDELDVLELFLIPEILGGGIPMIPPGARRNRLRLTSTDRWGDIARLIYTPMRQED